ncbi:unnamed protein product [Notodromas monacha]|uniref:EGF-like domain-containing protein n=1 Tax=Notodromas monacha TaxID=399045 RepID=A0A7R9GB76_9CRUS|nr:unnamed protein product [Notodromas monacha]CAG0914735.1 unnamed protein product [Notodromas monacha]
MKNAAIEEETGWNGGEEASGIVWSGVEYCTGNCRTPDAPGFAISRRKLGNACSSRSTPTPRPATPSATPIRPNVTFQTYACPPAYAAWYCLNGATCFTVKIGESLLYNCECADGYMGQRCEYKDLDGTYLRECFFFFFFLLFFLDDDDDDDAWRDRPMRATREKVTLETASIAGGATVAVIFVVIVCFLCWIYLNRKGSEKKQVGASSSSSSSSCHRRIGIGMGMRGGVDEVDALESGEDASFQPFARYGLPRHKSTFHLIPGTFKYSMHPSHQEMQNGQEDAGPGLHRLRPQPQPQPQPQADKKRVRGESSTLPS